jgi:hypothetical protein
MFQLNPTATMAPRPRNHLQRHLDLHRGGCACPYKALWMLMHLIARAEAGRIPLRLDVHQRFARWVQDHGNPSFDSLDLWASKQTELALRTELDQHAWDEGYGCNL